MSYRDIMNDPEMKIARWEYIHRREIKAEDERRQREQLKKIDTALETLADDPQRDKLVREAVSTIQHVGVPTVVKIEQAEIAVGGSANTLQDVRGVIEGELVEARKPGSPPWLPILWESMLESLEVKFKIGISIPPVDISVTLDAIKFVQLVSMRRAERI